MATTNNYSTFLDGKKPSNRIEAIDQPSTQKEFDLYSKSLICAVSQELLQDCRKIITANK
jgi:hypothetical protein